MRSAILALTAVLMSQPSAPPAVDISSRGPQPGATAPAFSLPDQDGRVRSLASVLGRNGALLVFSRSADW